MSADLDQIAERLGFFFSDANLRMDKFLRRIVLDKYTGGNVEIDTLLKFNTIKKLTSDPAIIASAVEKVESPKLKLNEAKTTISRVEPFTEDMLNDNVKVSLRVGGFPIKDEQYVNTREEVAELFSQYGKVALVRMITAYNKKEQKRVAVGKGFVEFADAEGFEKAVADLCGESPKNVLKLADEELRVKTMQAWLDKKAAGKDEKAGNKRAREEKLEQEKAEIEAIQFTLDWKKGCVIKMEGLPDGCDREMIIATVKSFFGDNVEARADYSRGDKDGKIRFTKHDEKINEFTSKLNDGSVTLGDAKITKASLMEGEEEEKYYADYIAFRTKQMREKAQEKFDRQKRRKH